MRKAAIVILLTTAIMGCQKTTPEASEQAGAKALQKITIAYTTQPQSTLVHVAVAKGYFVAEGLEVQSQIHTYGKAALQAVVDHKADFATVAETPIMFSVLNGDKIFVIANIESSPLNNGIVARKDAGIAVSADLKGKRIGFTPGTTSDFFLDSMLTVNGLTRQEILPIALKPEEMPDAIMNKRVDAVSTWNYPLTQIKQQLGEAGTVFIDRQIYTETFNIVVPQALVRASPETVKQFLRALIKAENFVAKYPEEAQAIMISATQVDKKLIRELWDAFNYRVVLDQSLLLTLEDETRWAMKTKLTEQTTMPDYAGYIHQESLRAVKPDALKYYR